LTTQAEFMLAVGEAGVGRERAELDDDVVDGSAIAENSVPLSQRPVIVRPVHQGRAELAPLAGVALRSDYIRGFFATAEIAVERAPSTLVGGTPRKKRGRR
jgi:hypothetical protein